MEIELFMKFPKIVQSCSGLQQLTDGMLYQTESDPNCEFELNEDRTKIRKKLKAAPQSATNSMSKSAQKTQDSETNVQ